MVEKYLVAVDDGYAQIKVAGDSLDKKVPSPILSSFRSSVKHGSIGSLNGNGAIGFYETDDGRTQMTVSDLVPGEATQFDGFHVSAMDRILVNHALISTGYSGKKVDLWVGLPVSDFFKGVEKNVDLIERKKKNLEEKVRNAVPDGEAVADLVSINVGCQAVSAFVDYLIDDTGEERDVPIERIAVVDIGGRTTDIAMIINGSTFVPEKSGTENIGVLDVMNELQSLIHKEFNVSEVLSSSVLDRALRTGKIKVWGKERDISSLVENASSGPVHKLERMIIQKLGKGSDLDAILFVGGGASCFSSIKSIFPHNGVLMDNAEFSNARGLYKYAKDQQG